jgi:bacillithiol synthase
MQCFWLFRKYRQEQGWITTPLGKRLNLPAMKDPECIPYAATGYFSPLIQDYLAQAEKLQPFYGQFPLAENFAALLKAKAQHFGRESRQRLVSVLRDQYAEVGLRAEPEAAWWQNIEALSEDNSYTITTGHQLSLLTGPLYFVYKIVTTLKMAAQLQEHYPQQRFVPIFWMASEDHDFAEINHVQLYGGTCRWESAQEGAVGRMNLEGLAPLLEELAEHLGPGTQASELMQLFREAYLDQSNLARATRLLVHRLFSDYGLVILDGDD